MARKLFECMETEKSEVNSDRKEWTGPEEKLVDSDLVNRLLECYIDVRDNRRLRSWRRKDFESLAQEVEPIIGDLGDKIQPQILIDSLTLILKDEPDRGVMFTRTDYLTVIVQVLYRLNHGNEFVIDIRNWPKDGHFYVGYFLEGERDTELILGLYGNFEACGAWADYCNFKVHGNISWLCGSDAKHCNFISYNNVQHCGDAAENCTFDMMPDANIKIYRAERCKGNKLRRMNENGEWERIG